MRWIGRRSWHFAPTRSTGSLVMVQDSKIKGEYTWHTCLKSKGYFEFFQIRLDVLEDIISMYKNTLEVYGHQHLPKFSSSRVDGMVIKLLTECRKLKTVVRCERNVFTFDTVNDKFENRRSNYFSPSGDPWEDFNQYSPSVGQHWITSQKFCRAPKFCRSRMCVEPGREHIKWLELSMVASTCRIL